MMTVMPERSPIYHLLHAEWRRGRGSGGKALALGAESGMLHSGGVWLQYGQARGSVGSLQLGPKGGQQRMELSCIAVLSYHGNRCRITGALDSQDSTLGGQDATAPGGASCLLRKLPP